MARDKPYYPNSAIRNIETLAKCLGVAPRFLSDLANDSDNSYTEFLIPKKDGKDRKICEPKYNLKKIQKRINSRIFKYVQFPSYLQGGICDPENPRDHVNNSKIHAGSLVLVSLDIKNFYDNIKYNSVLDIFRNFFKFSDDVSKVLSDLVTLRGRVPQGACTSSYIANLIFYNKEYSLVNKFSSRKIKYSRLLDDVSLSSDRELSEQEITDSITDVSGMFKKHGLRIHPDKKKIEYSSDTRSEYKVTGVWISHNIPKLRRKDRDYIRQLVYICEKEYLKDNSSDDYHELWNRSSSKVATMCRLQHAQAKQLRRRMSNILPVYSENRKKQLAVEVKKLMSRNQSDANSIGFIKAYNKAIHSIGILSRNDKALSIQYRKMLKEKFPNVNSEIKHWEN